MLKAPSCGLLASLLLAAACGSDDPSELVDGPPMDSPACDPFTVLPASFRPVAKVSTGTLMIDAMTGRTDVDATAGGSMMSADNPYIYLNLKTGTKVDVNDLDARTSTAWDVAFKRSSVRVNGGDSGSGGRKLAVVQAATLAEVTAAPTSGYQEDDFTDANCMLVVVPDSIEPRTAFGLWYNYVPAHHVLLAKPEVYIIERPDGTHTALRIQTYYRNPTYDPGDQSAMPPIPPTLPSGGGVYEIEWKQL